MKRDLELKKAIIDWLIANAKTYNRANECTRYFRPYIYDSEGNYLIGGKEVAQFISEANKLLFD